MAGRFDGKVVLVTGAGSGIGRATALAFAREGATVYAADVNEAGLKETAAMAPGEQQVRGLPLDVSDPGTIRRAVDAVVAKAGGLAVAVNNAGVLTMKPLDQMTDADLDRVLAINARGVVTGMREEVRAMRERGGSIVNVASVAGLIGIPHLTAYSASKGAVIAATRAVAVELATAGIPIRVNAIAPGGVRTLMVAGLTPEQEPGAVGRMAEPEQIADVFPFLASAAASHLTGVVLPVDYAMTAA